MSDELVGDLRELANEWVGGTELNVVMTAAADEIERLRDRLTAAEAELVQLRKAKRAEPVAALAAKGIVSLEGDQ